MLPLFNTILLLLSDDIYYFKVFKTQKVGYIVFHSNLNGHSWYNCIGSWSIIVIKVITTSVITKIVPLIDISPLQLIVNEKWYLLCIQMKMRFNMGIRMYGNHVSIWVAWVDLDVYNASSVHSLLSSCTL